MESGSSTARRPFAGRAVWRDIRGIALIGLALFCAAAFPGGRAAAASLELPAGVTVQHDGAGGLSVVAGDEVLLSCELRWMNALDNSSTANTAPSGTALSVAAGARLQGRDPDEFEISHLATRDRTPLVLAARLRHWTYFHVDDIAFVDAALRSGDAPVPQGVVALGIDSATPWALRRIRQRPHLSVGRAPAVEFDLVQAVFDRDDGERLYLGLVRLDRRRARVLADGPGLVWEAGTEPTWPLALIAARTRDSLEQLAGQALLTYDRAGEAETFEARWKVPPLCGRCRDPRIDEVRAELRADEGELLLRLVVRENEPVENVVHEGVRVEGLVLGRALRREQGGESEYGLPLADARAKILVDAATRGSLDIEVWTQAEVGVRPLRVDLVVAEGTVAAVARARAAREAPEESLPSYLSPELVSSWPNPFRGETTIEITVPATLREAFDLEETALARMDPNDPVPFGESPTVRVRVYNVGGQLVQTLSEEVRAAGRFAVQWNGYDAQGQAVAAGAYYVNVEMGDWSVTRRVLRLAP